MGLQCDWAKWDEDGNLELAARAWLHKWQYSECQATCYAQEQSPASPCAGLFVLLALVALVLPFLG